jgi:UDP-N-acetylglucosamine:LPS N-acetylglucosamine transferase
MNITKLQNVHFVVIRGILNSDYAKFDQYDNVTTIDFADQKTMAVLYQHCDIAITRAGTTSMAEQKLWDMKLCMVPLPWTHDQYDNALYYQKQYDDQLIEQDEELSSNLRRYLLSHASYRKKLLDKERPSLIASSKRLILDDIFIY